MSQQSGFKFSNDKQLTGAILIAVGVLALLGAIGVFRFVGGLLGAVLFAVLAYYAYTQGERRGKPMWRLAAFPLAGLALASILPGWVGGATFLASIGLAFAVFYRYDEKRWWALIPAGTFASLAAVAFFEGALRIDIGWLFLLGLAATFFALTRLKVEPQSWAIWPAGVLAAISLMAFVDSGSWLVPALLIAGGGWLLLRSGKIELPGRPSELNSQVTDQATTQVTAPTPPTAPASAPTAAPTAVPATTEAANSTVSDDPNAAPNGALSEGSSPATEQSDDPDRSLQ